ncbi:MAG: hypothetical protein GY852_01200, partial [bacterium]|nr:hypothetical protein [bacterium]
MQADDIPQPLTIHSITFDPVPGGGEVTFYEFSVDLGYCISDELGLIYEENYKEGSKTRVFETFSNITFTASSPTINFDIPFSYSPEEGNLIIDIIWPDGENEFFTYNFA